jgi:hypothetical protein
VGSVESVGSVGSVGEDKDGNITGDKEAFSEAKSQDCKLLYLERVSTSIHEPSIGRHGQRLDRRCRPLGR